MLEQQKSSQIILSESLIIDHLNRKYISNIRYKLSNAYIFKGNWESDFFLQRDNGYCYEFEIKISRSDFFNDKKKVDKHQILSEAKYITNHKTYQFDKEKHKPIIKEEISKVHDYNFRPNKFFYVVPENMITVDEIPKYAGLIYFCQDKYQKFKTVKEAPFIHKNKLKFEDVLCNKFYNYWLNSKIKIKELGWEISDLKEEIIRLKKDKEILF